MSQPERSDMNLISKIAALAPALEELGIPRHHMTVEMRTEDLDKLSYAISRELGASDISDRTKSIQVAGIEFRAASIAAYGIDLAKDADEIGYGYWRLGSNGIQAMHIAKSRESATEQQMRMQELSRLIGEKSAEIKEAMEHCWPTRSLKEIERLAADPDAMFATPKPAPKPVRGVQKQEHEALPDHTYTAMFAEPRYRLGGHTINMDD